MQRDNEQIYHERVKEDSELESSPAKQLAVPLPFTPPPAEEVSIQERGGWGCVLQ